MLKFIEELQNSHQSAKQFYSARKNATNVVFGMSVPYRYRSLFFKKNVFSFYQLMIFFRFFLSFKCL